MGLYEITTGQVGESYVRSYSWAADSAEARRLFAEQNPGHVIRRVTLLLDQRDAPFCTKASDHGWERDGLNRTLP